MGSVGAFDNDGAGNCECDSCVDCTAALNDAACDVVTLTQDLAVNGTCIWLSSDGKTFDCDGHTITGNRTGKGIFVHPNAPENGTIMSCNLINFSTGIHFVDVSDFTIRDVTVTENNGTGMYGDGVNMVIDDITASDNFYYGVFLSGIRDSLITDLSCERNGDYGLRFVGVGNTVRRVKANSQLPPNAMGVRISNSSGNTFSDVETSFNPGNGFMVEDSDDNTLSDIAASDNGWNGIVVQASVNNTFSDSLVANNTLNGFIMNGVNGSMINGIDSISNKGSGFDVKNSSDNVFDDVFADGNTNLGLAFISSLAMPNYRNVVKNSRFTNNDRGILFGDPASHDNLLQESLLCSNVDFDVWNQEFNNINNTGINNRCGTTLDWNETGLGAGCTFPCPVCGDGICDALWGNEDWASCPADCPPVCGDGACNGAETSADCPEDCGTVCGDGVCNGGEDTTNCVADCGTLCGDGVCNGNEDCGSCEDDCGKCKKKDKRNLGSTTMIVPPVDVPVPNPPAPPAPEPKGESDSKKTPAGPPEATPNPSPVAVEHSAPPAPMVVSGDDDYLWLFGLLGIAGLLFLFLVAKRRKKKENGKDYSIGKW